MKSKQNIKSDKKKFSFDKDLIYIAIYLLITVILFAPVIFSDKTLFGTDSLSAGYFYRSFYGNMVKNLGEFPLWLPCIHGGVPFVEGMHGDTFYPVAWLSFIMPVHRVMALKLVLHIFLAGLFAYLFFREKGCKKIISFFSGIFWMLLPIMVSLIYASQDGKIFVTSLLPLLFYLIEKALKYGRVYHYLLFSLSYALLILTPHLQMAYFASWAIGLYFFFRIICNAIDNKKFVLIIKPLILFILAIFLALMVCVVQLIPEYDYVGKYSMRTMHTEETKTGYEYATSWSFYPEEIVSLFIANFAGLNVEDRNDYWGRNQFKLNSDYIGIIILFLALIPLIFKRSRESYFFLGLSLLGLIYSVGNTTPLFKLFYYLVPGVKKFRGPSMIIYITAFALLNLAVIGLQYIFEEGKKKKNFNAIFLKYGLTFLTILGLFTILMTIGSSVMLSIWNSIGYGDIGSKVNTMKLAIPCIIGNYWIALVLAGITFFLSYLYLKGKTNEYIVMGFLCFATIIDFGRVDKPFIKPVDINTYFQKTPIIDFFNSEQKKEPFRVLLLPNTLSDNYLALYGIEEVSFTAMHGNHLRLYDEFVGRHEQQPNLMNPRFWDLLNVKFVVAPQEYQIPWLYEITRYGKYIIYQNLNYLPRAFPYYNYVVKNHDEVLNTIKDQNFSYRRTLILENPIEIPSSMIPDSIDTINSARVYDNKINSFKVDVDMKYDGLLFLSENYFPAWKCYEGNIEHKIIVSDYIFRAIPLKAGQHTLLIKYESGLLSKSFKISIFSALGLILITILSGLWNKFKPQKKT